MRLILILLLFPLIANAITLNEAEKLAFKNYPRIKALGLQSRSLKQEEKSTKLSRLGSINLLSSYQTLNRNYMLVPMSHLPNPMNPPAFDSQKLIYGISYSAPLYVGGTVSRKADVYKLRSEILNNIKNLTKWQIRYRVREAYLDYLSLENIKKALVGYQESLEKLKNDVDVGISAGKFAKVDLLKVDYDLQSVSSKIETVKSRETALKTLIETLIGQRINRIEPYKISYHPFKAPTEELYKIALRNNDEIKAKIKEVRVNKKLTEIASGKYGPRITFNVQYNRNYGFDSGKNEGYGLVSVNLNLPIFEFGQKQSNILSASLLKLSSEKELETQKRTLRSEIANAISNVISIQSDIDALKKQLRLALETERIETLKYETGKGDMDHLLLAKSHRFITQANLNSSYYKWKIAVSKLESLVEENL